MRLLVLLTLLLVVYGVSAHTDAQKAAFAIYKDVCGTHAPPNGYPDVATNTHCQSTTGDYDWMEDTGKSAMDYSVFNDIYTTQGTADVAHCSTRGADRVACEDWMKARTDATFLEALSRAGSEWNTLITGDFGTGWDQPRHSNRERPSLHYVWLLFTYLVDDATFKNVLGNKLTLRGLDHAINGETLTSSNEAGIWEGQTGGCHMWSKLRSRVADEMARGFTLLDKTREGIDQGKTLNWLRGQLGNRPETASNGVFSNGPHAFDIIDVNVEAVTELMIVEIGKTKPYDFCHTGDPAKTKLLKRVAGNRADPGTWAGVIRKTAFPETWTTKDIAIAASLAQTRLTDLRGGAVQAAGETCPGAPPGTLHNCRLEITHATKTFLCQVQFDAVGGFCHDACSFYPMTARNPTTTQKTDHGIDNMGADRTSFGC